MRNDSRTSRFVDYLLLSFGAAVYALSVDFFTAPNHIAPGGVTGISTMLNHLFGVPIGGLSLLLNIPLLIWGVVVNGRAFLVRTLFSTIAVSLFIDLFSLLPVTYTGDRLLAAGFGGLMGGFGLGLIFLRGGTTGGTDIIARNLHRAAPHLSVGSIILICDVIVVSAAAVVYHSFESALYAVVALFISTKVIDAVVYGFSRDNGKLLFIITGSPSRLSAEILSRSPRGVTVLSAHGGYTGRYEGVLLCAVRPAEVHLVRRIINEVDPSSFVIIATASAISGEGFTS